MGVAVKLVLGVLLLVGIAGGGLYVLSQQQPTVASGMKKVPVTAAAAKSFDDKVKALEKAAADAKASGRSAPVQATFTEEELTSAVNQAAASASGSSATGGLAATDTQIHLADGNVVATSNVTVQGITIPIGVVATPTVVNGQVTMVVQQVQTGAVPLPDAVKQQLQAQVGQAIDPTALGLPVNISNLQIQNGQLMLSGSTKP